MLGARLSQGGTVIKFRCTRCGQKISIDDEGSGLEIACPTCAERLLVPRETALEFQLPPAEPALVPVLVEDNASALPPPSRAELAPHLARLLTDRLVQELWTQRMGLLGQQQSATADLTAFEARLARVGEQLGARLQQAEQRVAELEAERERLLAENQRLRRQRDQAVAATSADAGFLLRA